MEENAELRRLQQLIRELGAISLDVELPGGDVRSLAAIGCLHVAKEHQRAIALLCAAGMYGSAFALLRVLVEAVVRGVWLHRCASEQEVRKFKEGKVEKKFFELVSDIEAKVPSLESALTLYKNAHWSFLNEFTHTGFAQVVRRYDENVTGTGMFYSDEHIAMAVRTAAIFGHMAYNEVITMSGRTDLMEKMRGIEKKYDTPFPIGKSEEEAAHPSEPPAD